jgi:hypothetical protein
MYSFVYPFIDRFMTCSLSPSNSIRNCEGRAVICIAGFDQDNTALFEVILPTVRLCGLPGKMAGKIVVLIHKNPVEL